jgi:hypothetical protein
VRGLNSPDYRLMVRNLLRQWRVDIVRLQETKLEFISRSDINSIWGCPYVDWCYVAAIGAGWPLGWMWRWGNMWRLVPSRMWLIALSGPSQGCMVPTVIVIDGCYGMNWWGYCVGGICLSVLGVISMPLGSLVRGLEGGRHISSAMREFSDFIFERGLMDLPLTGGLCTWSNSRSCSRIDRFLVSPDWEARHPEVLQKRSLSVFGSLPHCLSMWW